jgi:Kef-type K+ transport system membrane component KefB
VGASSLIVIAAAAFLLPLVSGRLRVPAVVLEIIFGALIGPSVLDVVESSPLLDQMALLGFFLLMFLSGFEIDVGLLRRQGSAQLLTGAIVFALTLLLAYAASSWLGHGPFLMFVLGTTSLGLVVPTLRSTRRSTTSLGQTILISAILADMLTLVGVTLFAVREEHGVGWELAGVPAFFLIVGVVLFVMRRIAWWYPERVERLFRADDPDELGIRSSLALMLVFVGLAQVLRIEPILGAFLAGSIFAIVFRHRGALEQQLRGFAYGFFIPVFFINVGINFDLDLLVDQRDTGGVLALLAAAILVKMLPALVFLVRGFSLRDVLAAGSLLSARLSLIIAVAELGVRLELITPQLESEIILLAAVSAVIAPSVFRWLAPPLAAREAREPG